ncbi:MAG: hypothetical protein JNK66_05750 [Chitinophagales bacterium]|nr:hypothetical protein [Chitinophagales bacterium]
MKITPNFLQPLFWNGSRCWRMTLTKKSLLAVYPEDYRWSSAKYYVTGVDNFGLITHYASEA